MKFLIRLFRWLFRRKPPQEPPKEIPTVFGNIHIRRRINWGKNIITVPAELIKNNAKTVWVRLIDGHIIKRHRRDVVKW